MRPSAPRPLAPCRRDDAHLVDGDVVARAQLLGGREPKRGGERGGAPAEDGDPLHARDGACLMKSLGLPSSMAKYTLLRGSPSGRDDRAEHCSERAQARMARANPLGVQPAWRVNAVLNALADW